MRSNSRKAKNNRLLKDLKKITDDSVRLVHRKANWMKNAEELGYSRGDLEQLYQDFMDQSTVDYAELKIKFGL